MTVEAGELERGWRLVESRGMPAADTVVADPLFDTAESPMVGLDAVGARHLLIPIGADAADVATVTGAAVTLTKRSLVMDASQQTYADVACTRPDLFDEFAVLAAEIVNVVAAEGAEPAASAARVIDDWRELLRALTPPRLDRGGIVGLFAELMILESVLQRAPRRSSDCWTGPSRGRYDFQRGARVLEVKGSTARRGRPVVIHGIDQLEEPPNAALYLCWTRLEVGVERGESLRQIVERLLDLVRDPADLEQKLRNSGYDFATSEVYETPLLTELERRLYRVDEKFPKLIRKSLVSGDLPHGVLAVEYAIELSGDQPEPLEQREVDRLLDDLAGVR
jgi:Putative  PD-(D/E)XK family member, (DUF4420)